MNSSQEQPEPESEPGSRFHTVQPLRDLEANWAVDLAKNLSEYLLKICSGEITSSDDHHHHVPQFSVNFAEAALLLQGSVQVYSRKVEYLYSLVLHALEFVSQKSSHEQGTSASAQSEERVLLASHEEENDIFWVLDDILVEAKNLLDSGKDALANHFVRPPANLVVLEGDCLDAIGDAGELESYLLATNDLFRDFILLDSCDAIAVVDFLNSHNKAGNVSRGSSLNCKSRKSFQSPTRRSGGTGHRLSAQKNQDADINQSPLVNHDFQCKEHGVGSSPAACNFPGDDDGYFNMENGHSESDDSDNDDPWKPLNPHEPGNLKVKPYKKAKINRRLAANSRKHSAVMVDFPLARRDGPISAELTEIWEAKCSTLQRQREPHSPPLFEKLRQSFFVQGGNKEYNTFSNPKEDNTDNEYDSEDPGNEPPDFNMPENTYMYEDVPQQDKHDGNIHLDLGEGFEDPASQASLEDLCRSHLDSLLASLAETEKQTELAARVSTWKQRIEQNLEEQDSRPSFDIHEYGERVMSKLCMEGDAGNSMSFADVVKGQMKHDVARTFSALLQLVNNGDVELEKSGLDGQSICYSVENSFNVHLLQNEKRNNLAPPQLSKKRAKSPKRLCSKGERIKPGKENRPIANVSSPMSTSTCRFSVKLGKPGLTKCTPEGKKRRKSRFVEPVNLHSTG
ncbi:hypothetical protein ACH5RR_031081 [Cinchona calisaya]|uniref:Condensin-2 complex subunit H2 n=1 Tax=Cinchona calisaya TaxID=153742 RepID=A0ABD2YH91_9GENT